MSWFGIKELREKVYSVSNDLYHLNNFIWSIDGRVKRLEEQIARQNETIQQLMQILDIEEVTVLPGKKLQFIKKEGPLCPITVNGLPQDSTPS